MSRCLTIAFRAVIFTLVAALVAVFVADLISDDPEHARPPHADPPISADLPGPRPSSLVVQEATEQAMSDLEAWVAGTLEGIERDRIAAEEAERLAAARQPANSPMARTGTLNPSTCDGHIIPGYILQRESGCDYGAVSPPGFCGGNQCFGLYQISGIHWNGGGCADLDWTVPADQDECARRLSRDGTNLAPWGG